MAQDVSELAVLALDECLHAPLSLVACWLTMALYPILLVLTTLFLS